MVPVMPEVEGSDVSDENPSVVEEMRQMGVIE